MTLKELIAQLSLYDPNKIVAKGFSSPHSYRGYYHELAFEPTDNVTVGSMLADAESALGKTFQGYKGGEFKMGGDTTVNLAALGCGGEPLSSGMLSWMIEGSDSADELARLRAQVAALVALVEELHDSVWGGNILDGESSIERGVHAYVQRRLKEIGE